MWTLTLALAIFGLSTGLGARSATAATEKESELSARQAFAAARYDEAIEIFARLYAETLNPIYLRNIGRCHQKKRDPDKAIDAFQDYLAKGKSISSAERKEIQGYIKDMERLRDQQAKEKQAQAKDVNRDKDKAVTLAPPAAAPTPPTSAPAPAPPASPTPAVPPPSTVNLAPTNAGPWPGYGPAPPSSSAPAAGPAAGGAMLVARPAGPPSSDEHHPVYTRWWFWTAIGVVVAGGVAAALLIPGGTSRPSCFDNIPGDCK